MQGNNGCDCSCHSPRVLSALPPCFANTKTSGFKSAYAAMILLQPMSIVSIGYENK